MYWTPFVLITIETLSNDTKVNDHAALAVTFVLKPAFRTLLPPGHQYFVNTSCLLFCFCFFLCSSSGQATTIYNQIRRIVVPRKGNKFELAKVKFTVWCQWKGLVTRIMHAKYQCSIINTSEHISQDKVFVTDGQTDGRMSFNAPRFR